MTYKNVDSGVSRVDALLARSGAGAGILRSREDKRAFVTVLSAGDWQLYALAALNDVPARGPLLRGTEPGRHALAVDPGKRCYFLFVQGECSLLLAERLLPLSGAWNCRDLGGLPTRDGRLTAWGRLFRTDGLSRLTDADCAYIDSIPVASVADFRTPEETRSEPDRLPGRVRRRELLTIMPGRIDKGSLERAFSGGVGDGFMEDMYRSLVEDAASRAAYREFFSLVQEERHLPLLFHCSAGKDRTGLAAAIILHSLGVDNDLIMADYMDSALYLDGKYDAALTAYPERAALFMVKPSYIRAGFEAMQRYSGSIDAYIAGVLGINTALMRRLFLQP